VNRYQPIYDIAEICANHGLGQAILCPGSRSAPLTLAFSRHAGIICRTFSDERSAAFVALGMAQQTQMPTILVCTSGSAAYNLAPAVAEAYYAQTPLLIFTADRPAEWIDQLDGQAIRQENIFGAHVKRSFSLPDSYDHADAQWHINRTVNEAIALSLEYPSGPVHINAPFREPLYPAKSEEITFSKNIRTVEGTAAVPKLSEKESNHLKQVIGAVDRILIVAGQGTYNETLIKAVEKFAKQQQAALVGDVISNFHGALATVRFSDSFLAQGGEPIKKILRPDLLITFGKSVISKNLKLFLRQHQPKQHWHIQESGPVADTFQSLTRTIHTTPQNFFESLLPVLKKTAAFEGQKRENFFRLWEAEEHRTDRSIEAFFKSGQLQQNGNSKNETSFGELTVVRELIKALPQRCNLHLANSMSVRYANFIGLASGQKGIHVFANRGTSGIDGCTSTAVGHSLLSEVPNFLITGDMAFFYDRNAFWHNYPIPNLRIIVLNNHGGIIFGIIDGPEGLPEKDEYFVTKQNLKAESLAGEFGFDYLLIENSKKLKNTLKDFFTFDGKTKILEIESSQAANKTIFEQFKKQIKKGYT
jgi:2-succinyl-5-enolpyruvyl-6-hydroxy-3-cyclohexene-1-carboxylate synthase